MMAHRTSKSQLDCIRDANLWKLKSVIRMLKIRNFGQKSVISSMVFATSRKWHGMQRCVKNKNKNKIKYIYIYLFDVCTLIKHKTH